MRSLGAATVPCDVSNLSWAKLLDVHAMQFIHIRPDRPQPALEPLRDRLSADARGNVEAAADPAVPALFPAGRPVDATVNAAIGWHFPAFCDHSKLTSYDAVRARGRVPSQPSYLHRSGFHTMTAFAVLVALMAGTADGSRPSRWWKFGGDEVAIGQAAWGGSWSGSASIGGGVSSAMASICM